MPRKPRKARVRMPKQPRKTKTEGKNKQKMTQEVHVNLSSGGGSASSMPMPTAFADRSGENVVLQKLTDAVNNFMKQAQDVKRLEPRTVLPVQYNDSPFDETHGYDNPLLNPRPNKNNQSLMSQINEQRESNRMASEDIDAPEKMPNYGGLRRNGGQITDIQVLRNQINTVDKSKRNAILNELKKRQIISTITVKKIPFHQLAVVHNEFKRQGIL